MIVQRWLLPPEYEYYWFEELDSTNAEALRRIEAGEKPDSWICADRQTMGRGAHGNSWHSQDGNIYASLHLRTHCSIDALPQLSLLAGLAVLSSIEHGADRNIYPQELCLKWPNDVLLKGGKICGVLVESRPQEMANGLSPFDVVIGIGINIADSPIIEQLFPPTHLRAHGWTVTRDELFVELVRSMRDWLTIWREGEGFEEVRLAWLQRSCHIGRTLTIQTGATINRGRFTSINQQGALVLVNERGCERTVVSGHLVSIDNPQ